MIMCLKKGNKKITAQIKTFRDTNVQILQKSTTYYHNKKHHKVNIVIIHQQLMIRNLLAQMCAIHWLNFSIKGENYVLTLNM